MIEGINLLLNSIEWKWYTKNEDTLYWHWSPTHDWKMDFAMGGYNECLITYVMAASSLEYGIDSTVYHNGWAQNGRILSKNEHLVFH